MFYGWFENEKDVTQGFSISPDALEGCTVLFAAYDGDYDGQALVVFRRNDQLFEVNGGHCSCYGLEDQWDPELTSVEALRHRVERGTLGYTLGGYTVGFNEMLEKLSREG
jgi:hypothetical protein